MANSNSMSERIHRLRCMHGYTLEQVANRVGVGKSTVRKWETGMIANMRRDKIASLAAALHTTPAYLMGWEDSPATAYPAAQELNEQEVALIELFRALAPAEKDEAVEYLRYLKDRDELEQLRQDLQAALAAQKGAAER